LLLNLMNLKNSSKKTWCDRKNSYIFALLKKSKNNATDASHTNKRLVWFREELYRLRGMLHDKLKFTYHQHRQAPQEIAGFVF
jgi:hypothetical protein